MASRQCLVEVNRTIRAAGLDEDEIHAAAVGLARNLARRIDKAGPEDAPLNLLRLYDSALTKLQRAAAAKAAPKPGRDQGQPVEPAPVEPSGPPALKIVEESPLDRVRRNKRAAAG